MSVTVSTCRHLFAVVLMAGTIVTTDAAEVDPSARSGDLWTLIELSAARLRLSQAVALTKWDAHLPIADPPDDPREQEVIAVAAQVAEERGLDRMIASSFFADQIEASKLVQIALHARWLREGHVPTGRRSDLQSELRPAMDALRDPMIEALLAIQPTRADGHCAQALADALAAHAQRQGLPPLMSMSLERGLARVCADTAR